MSLVEQLRAFCSDDYELVREGLDPVNEPMIRHWCEALGDENPVYTDAALAASSIHGGIVAPPTMVGAWTMRPIDPGPPDPRDGRRALIAALDDAGFTGIVATNTEQEYARYLRPGDRVTARIRVESVSNEKDTALGPGFFFTTTTTYTDAEGEVVATERFRMLKFKPAARASSVDTSPAARTRPAMNDDTRFFWEGAARGELLVQRCSSCGTLRHPPRPMCAACRSLEWDTVRSDGRGEVYSFVIYHHPPLPGFELPYVVALVSLPEGVRILSNVVDVSPGEVKIGMPVDVSFLDLDDDTTLPVFRPAGGAR